MRQIAEFFINRIQVNSLLVVISFASVLILPSQSAASYATYILAVVMLFTFGRWSNIFRVQLLWLVLSFIVYLWASSFWSSPFEVRSFNSVSVRALLVILFVVALAECYQCGQTRKWLGRVTVILGCIAALLAFADYYDRLIRYGYRLQGIGQLHNPVVFGLTCGILIVFALDRLFNDASRAWTIVCAMCVPILLIALGLSGSRNAWASTIIGSSLFVMAHIVKTRKWFVVSAISMGFMCLILIGWQYSSETLHAVLLPRGDSSRLEIWSLVLEKLKEGNWLLGFGILTDDNLLAPSGKTFEHPHSIFLSVAFQGGLISLTLFLSLIAGMIRALLANYDQLDAKFALGVLGLGLSGLVFDGHGLIDKVGLNWFFFWLPAAISVGLSWHWSARGPQNLGDVRDGSK